MITKGICVRPLPVELLFWQLDHLFLPSMAVAVTVATVGLLSRLLRFAVFVPPLALSGGPDHEELEEKQEREIQEPLKERS